MTPERLREVLEYDAETGVMRWRVVRRGSRNRPGDVAGTVRDPATPNPYLVVFVDGTLYRAEAAYEAYKAAAIAHFGDFARVE